MHGRYSLIVDISCPPPKKVQNTQDIVHRPQKVNKLKGPSEDVSDPLGREKKAITNGEVGRDLGGNVDGGVGGSSECGEENLIWYWVREREGSLEGQQK